MERYDLGKKIPSCSVDKSLISQIEKYLTKRLSKKMKAILSSDEVSKIDYTIKIKDDFGEEYISSIDEYHREKFPNDTQEITLNYQIYYRSVDIRVIFSKSFSYSGLNINVSCEGAKEVALGISNEINGIIRENKTIHYIFYDKFAWVTFCFWVISTNFWSWFKSPFSNQLWFFFFFIGVMYFFIRQISPYSTFDTNKEAKRERFSSWLLNGLAGVFLFGVIAVSIREYFL